MIYLVNLLKSTKGVPKMSFNHININQLTNLEANYYLGVKARACAQRMKIVKDKAYRYYKLFMQGLTIQDLSSHFSSKNASSLNAFSSVDAVYTCFKSLAILSYFYMIYSSKYF